MKQYVNKKLSLSPVAQQFLSASFWSLVADGLSKGLVMISMILMARILDKDGFGQFGMIKSTINLFATVGGMGLGLTANKYLALSRNNDKAYAGTIIGSSYLLSISFGLLIGSVLYFGAEYISLRFFETDQLIDGLKIASFLVFFGAINGAQVGILQGFGAYRRLAAGSLFQGLISLLCLVGGAYYFGVNGALIGFFVSALFAIILFYALIKFESEQQGLTACYKGIAGNLSIFWQFSVPVVLTGIAVAPFKWFPETILVKDFGFESLGLFQASFIIATAFITVVSTLNSPLISLLAGMDKTRISTRVQYLNLYGSWFLFLILAAPLILFPGLLSLVFGQKYDTDQFYQLSLLLILYAGLMLYFQGVARVFIQNNLMWVVFFTNLIEGVSLVIAFYMLQKHGVIALAIAYLVSYGARIMVTVPILLKNKLVSASLLFDKYFCFSFIVVLALTWYQSSLYA